MSLQAEQGASRHPAISDTHKKGTLRCLLRLFGIKRVFGEDYPGAIDVQVAVGEEYHVIEVGAYVAFSNTFT